jgi:hypothetical protein
MNLVRVFPRITRATPDDPDVYHGPPDMFVEADEVHISVLFTYDIHKAEQLAEQWKHVALVNIGGPATGMRGENFEPGRYVKKGYVITSRGCPNRCWFCSVWRREGSEIRELPIVEGNNILDDNLLACSDEHIKAVFSMLKKQKGVEFTGGLEAARLKPWHIDLLKDLKPKQMFFAYDTPDDYEPLADASLMLINAGFTRSSMRAYVLIGFPKDTKEQAEARLYQTLKLGFYPMAMLWANQNGDVDLEWRKFQREWVRPAIISAKEKEINKKQIVEEKD